MDDITNHSATGFIRAMREVMPNRALSLNEAYQLAERQATLTLQRLRIEQPDVPLGWVLKLPRVEVQLEPRHTMSNLAGFTVWRERRYLVVVNKSDPHGRRRFTLAHELKHVLDYTLWRTIYARLGSDEEARDRNVERVANHFAACLLMPRTWIKRAWGNGIQGVEELAGLFNVTPSAIRTRLQYLDLLPDDRPTDVFFRRQPTLRDLAREVA
jgi:predicted transcriptional regulator